MISAGEDDLGELLFVHADATRLVKPTKPTSVCQQEFERRVGSTRVVRFLASVGKRINEPDDMATGPQDGEVFRCVEPVESERAQYREFAEECRRLAQLAQTAEERKVLQEMEAAWTKLAGEVEKKSSAG
jgi:hypothetical protein